MVDHARAARMAKRIMTIVATAIEHEIKDRRMEFVTVTDCRVTGDLHDATVFYTVRGATIDEEPDTALAADALASARGQLRKIVGDQLSVRFTPTLSFELDTVPAASAHMEELLAKARAMDEEVRQRSAGATPAGDPDPYRTPGDDGADGTAATDGTAGTDRDGGARG
ncbi:30S ribosome-binding factor RbfA [Corynebacterium bovis]|uniref:30S ribosome-binding factor RbfA n=1 Tax=Corynebacterium bovis TaxID=36808 RepID=UPI00313A3DE0